MKTRFFYGIQMGTDIHTHVEVRRNGDWEYETRELFEADEWDRKYGHTAWREPFRWRQYAMFGVLAHVRRNDCPCICDRFGWPDDLSPEMREEREEIEHTPRYLTLAELLAFDYDQPWTPFPDEPERNTVRKVLNPRFFLDLEVLKSLGDPEDVRVLFYFDS
jgi:hypothetical protein